MAGSPPFSIPSIPTVELRENVGSQKSLPLQMKNGLLATNDTFADFNHNFSANFFGIL